MLKNIIKELIIVLLLIGAILLLLGIFLYDYIPTSKIVPKIEQYQVPNTVKQELEASVTELEQEQTQIVYEIDGTDLKNYEKSQDYQKGKVNPFAQASEDAGNSGETDTENGSTGNTNSGVGGNNSNSVGNYLPNTGTK